MAGGGMRGSEACMAGGVCGRRDGYCSGRYTSYWNAFLSNIDPIMGYPENYVIFPDL